MKAIIKKEFVDKYTHECYKIGKTIELTAGRAAEIEAVDSSLIEIIDKNDPVNSVEPKAEETTGRRTRK